MILKLLAVSLSLAVFKTCGEMLKMPSVVGVLLAARYSTALHVVTYGLLEWVTFPRLVLIFSYVDKYP